MCSRGGDPRGSEPSRGFSAERPAVGRERFEESFGVKGHRRNRQPTWGGHSKRQVAVGTGSGGAQEAERERGIERKFHRACAEGGGLGNGAAQQYYDPVARRAAVKIAAARVPSVLCGFLMVAAAL
jgi:hypothetical protein